MNTSSYTPPVLRRRALIALAACMHAWPLVARGRESSVVLTIAGKGVKRVSDGALVSGVTAASIDEARFTLSELAALPQHSVTTTAPWHDGVRTYSGPLLRDVLAAAHAQAASARFAAINDYKIDIPLDDAIQYPVILAIRLEGKPMLVRDKGPLFLMYPFDKHPELKQTKYYSRCVWQLLRIELQ